MDVKKILEQLRAERAEIERAINALQKVVGGRRRGRPPKWMKDIDARALMPQLGWRFIASGVTGVSCESGMLSAVRPLPMTEAVSFCSWIRHRHVFRQAEWDIKGTNT
jgi:hypothetical protein